MKSLLFILSITTVATVFAAPIESSEEISRENVWRKVKVALPDGYYPGDEDNTPSIVFPEDHLFLPGHKPIYTHQEPAYKHSEVIEHTNITPLLPSEQKVELNEENNLVTEASTGKRYKKFMEKVKEQGILPNRIQQKKIVGKDTNGEIRYIDIPYYDRATT